MSVINKIYSFILPEQEDTEKNHTSTERPTNHILIDYENLLPSNLDNVNRDNCHIWLFVGKLQNKINTGLVQGMNDFGDRAHYIYLDVSQPNALDFHLSYYLGYIAATYPRAKVAILSKDKGYESIMRHASEQHNFTSITRHDSVLYVAVEDGQQNNNNLHDAKPQTAASPSLFSQCMRSAISFLIDPTPFLHPDSEIKNTHPKMRHRLEKLLAQYVIKSIYQENNKTIDEEQCAEQAKKLVDQLIISRYIVEDKQTSMIAYHTDDESLYKRMKFFVSKKRPPHVVQLKKLIAYNYAYRDINKDSDEICQLIERMKQDKLLFIVKGGHINYPENVSVVNMDQMIEKAQQFILRGHALPATKKSLFNVIGTHLGIKDDEQTTKKVIDQLIAKELVVIDEEDGVQYPQLNRDTTASTNQENC